MASAPDHAHLPPDAAAHHVYAFRLRCERPEFGYSDDDESSGSDGRPILNQLDGRQSTYVLVIVSRCFGGTKLGTGGLMRPTAALPPPHSTGLQHSRSCARPR